MADHGHHGHDEVRKSGSMDIREHEKTFEGFIRMTIWGAGISVAILIFLALANS